jgi:lycopene cyclase domain-containing protein
MGFYLTILLLSFSIPFLLSFDRKLHFFTQWKHAIPAILIVAVAFILMDMLYTHLRVWGFNPDYYLGIRIFNLPLEEVLFFILIPYACVFLHEVLKLYFPKIHLNKKNSNILSLLLLGMSVVLIVVTFPGLYSVYSLALTVLALLLALLLDKENEMGYFYFSFLVMLIPFVIVNGFLTGSFAGNEVVWYNNAENSSLRLLTIPVEDFGYGFGMLFLVVWIKKRLEIGKIR